MSTPALEAFLALLYTDEAVLAAFLKSPEETARTAGLDSETIAALQALDRDGLVMAARSFRAKRAGKNKEAHCRAACDFSRRSCARLGGVAIDPVAPAAETGTTFKNSLAESWQKGVARRMVLREEC